MPIHSSAHHGRPTAATFSVRHHAPPRRPSRDAKLSQSLDSRREHRRQHLISLASTSISTTTLTHRQLQDQHIQHDQPPRLATSSATPLTSTSAPAHTHIVSLQRTPQVQPRTINLKRSAPMSSTARIGGCRDRPLCTQLEWERGTISSRVDTETHAEVNCTSCPASPFCADLSLTVFHASISTVSHRAHCQVIPSRAHVQA